jgi:hypothetical protein
MLTHMSSRTDESQSLRRGSPYVVGTCSVLFAVISIFAGLVLSVATAWSGAAPAVEMVNRTVKGGRLPLVPTSRRNGISFLQAPALDQKLVVCCEPLASSLARSPLAQIAGRCLS